MRQDLDRLMQERGIAGRVVIAADRYCPVTYYVTGQKLHVAAYFRAADGRAHLIHDPMERDQAERAGCEASSFSQHALAARIEKSGGPAGGWADLLTEMLHTLGIRGKVAFFGDLSAGRAWDTLARVTELDSTIQIDRGWPDVITLARATKGPDEIDAIRHASKGVLAAWSSLTGYLRALKRDGEHFKNGGGAVTLGDLRALVNREFAAHGLEGGESIIAQGRDAGVPHNRGNDAEKLRAGAPVIVDLFPGEAGGGYFSDFTRTFCMGRAPDDLKRLYGDCADAFHLAMGSLKAGSSCRDYQERVCELFEKRGHATLRTNQGAEEGYVHGLGHGVGLSVHEAPRLGGPPSNTQALEPGMVVTVEPGLYYPSRGMGVRIEDLVAMTPDGRYENLTPAPYDLEIEPRA
jgi:Xaa-Pro aminopeptidase